MKDLIFGRDGLGQVVSGWVESGLVLCGFGLFCY